MSQERPTRRVEGRDLGDEYLIYDRSADRVHVLNSTAREILLLCDGSRTRAQVVAALAEKYEVAHATLEQDTEETLLRLTELDVLEWR